MYFFIVFATVITICNGDAIPTSTNPNSVCKRRNQYLEDDGSCDTYIECRDYEAVNMACPDGLNFNRDAQFPDYPCGYPVDVPCKAGAVSRPEVKSADCPRLYGIFPAPVAKKGDCGQYRICMDGEPIDMFCPPGLAFNPETDSCDWPDQVPSCPSNGFLEFTCPPAKQDVSGNEIVTNHKYKDDCYAFFSCQKGAARLLSCDMGLAFNEASGRCVDADQVVCNTTPHPQKT